MSSNIGEKRPATSEQGSEGAGEGESPEEEAVPTPKRPAPSFNFRPSLLQQATKGFSLKQSSLPSSLADASKPGEGDASKSSATPLQSGFLKLDSNELKPISSNVASLGAPSPSSTAFRSTTHPLSNPASSENSAATNQMNHTSEGASDNLFLQFLARTSSANSFSSVSATNSVSAMSTSQSNEAMPPNPTSDDLTGQEAVGGATEGGEEGVPAEAQTAASLNGSGASDDFPSGGGDSSAMFQGATAIFPEVTVLTGEEKEKKIVQVPARLYAFDVDRHNWKERGRGEVRLNDAAQSEGLFQSRLVMRASGSYRVLLNTYLWAQMKCERANQKSIRITAQHEDQVLVFLIMGATKDIQQLFTAVDRRIEALRRNQKTAKSKEQEDASSNPAQQHATPKSAMAQLPDDEDDKESFLGDTHSSPDSSPDCHASTARTRLAAAAVKTVGMPSSRGGGEKGEEQAGGVAEENEVERKNKKDVVVVVVTGEHEEGGATGPTRGGTRRRRKSSDEGLGRDEESASDKESTSVTPPSSRSPSLGRTSTTTISSSDNAPEANFSQ